MAASPSESSSPESTPDMPSLGRRVLKWGGGVIGGLAVVVVVAALVLPRLFTSEQLKGYVVPPLERATGRQVEIGAIGLRVLPAPAIRVRDFRLANAEGYGPAPAVEAEALNVDVALWPLFVGSLRPTAVTLEEPIVRYEVTANGATNFEDLGGTTDTTNTEGPLLGGIPLSNIRVTGAQLHYAHRGAGQRVRLGFDAQLGITPEGAALASAGTVDLQTVRAVLPSVGPDTIAVRNAQLDYDVRVAPSAGQVNLRTLRVETPPLTLTVEGGLSALNEQPRVDLRVETGATDLGNLAAFVPAAAIEGLNPRGTLQIEGTVSGPLPDDTGGTDSLSVALTGTLAGGGLDYEGTSLLRDLKADLSLSLDTLTVRSIQGTLLGRSLSGTVTVSNLMEGPRIDGRLAGMAELGPLMDLAGAASSGSVAGTADYDVRFAGPLDAPGAIRPRGRIRLSDVQVPYESFRHPIEVPEATIQLTGTGFSLDRFRIRSGAQTAMLQTTVRNLIPLSEGLAKTDPALSADFTLTADRLDLVELYPKAQASDVSYSQLFAAHLAGSEVKGQSPEALAESLYAGMELPAYTVNGQVEIGTLLNEPQRYDDLTMDVRMEDRRLVLRNISTRTYGGTLAGRIVLDQSGSSNSAIAPANGSVLLASTSAGRAPTRRSAAPGSQLTYDLELRKAQAGAVLQDWTTLGRLVTGTVTLDVNGETPLSEGLLPETSALTAVGESIVSDGGLSVDSGPARALVKTLNLPVGALNEFRRFGGPFAVKDGRLQMKTWTFGGRQLDGSVQGALGLGGSVDLEMTLKLPLSMIQSSDLASRLGGSEGGLGALLEKLVGGTSGEKIVPVTVQLGGTIRDPTVEVLNRKAVVSKIRTLAKEAGLKRLRDLFGGGGE